MASAPSRPNARRRIGALFGAGAVLLVGGVLHSLGLSIAHDRQQVASLFHNPFGPRPLANSLRHFQQGDSWEYRVTGTASLPSGQRGTITSGTLHSAITDLKSSQFDDITEVNDINLTFSMGGKALPFSHREQERLSQDLIGTTYLMSDNDGPQGAVRTVRQPQDDTPGAWSDGLIQASHLDFDDGEHRDETTTVQGSEVVETALGRLTVWRCVQDQTDSDGTHSITTLWFAPQLGMPVRTAGTTTLPDGMVMTLDTDLTKTTVPL